MEENNINIENKGKKDNCKKDNKQGGIIGGVVLITLGILFLLDQFLPNVNFGDLWPVLLIVIGVSILFKNYPCNRNKNSES
ncbi:MAG: DUF5668 domain-containing protein [Saprospiraceae bacterium]|nr:DUF5668 domain-containing protein [Saprospiraceae bacterium]